MIEDDQFEEFLLPVEGGSRPAQDTMISGGLPVDSPSRRLGTILNVHNAPKVPESPDMKFARKRLGNLLTTIKHLPADVPSEILDEYGHLDDADRRPPGRPPGRPRKSIHTTPTGSTQVPSQLTLGNGLDQKIMFELRGKPFELISGRNDCEYSLCRAWVRGTVEPEVEPKKSLRTEFAPNLAVDYLACREIYKMPKASSLIAELPILPRKVDEFNKDIDPNRIGLLQVEYARHWKAVKRGWMQHQRKRAAKYTKNIQLLEKIFSPESNQRD